jgi:hypothetical protein
VKPSWRARWPSWKISFSRPLAAPTDIRFSPVVVAGWPGERKAIVGSTNASPRTNANTIDAARWRTVVKSWLAVVVPATA